MTGNKTILVVEDHAMVGDLLREFLENLLLEVRVVGDGKAAVRYYEEHRPAIILMDVFLPEMDGLKATHAIRRISGNPDTPWIIGVSAGASTRERQHALSSGMNRFLPKPIDFDALREAIRQPGQVNAPPALGLAADFSPSLRMEWLGRFEAEAPRRLAQLEDALANNDWNAVERAAHHLKNSAAVIAAPLLDDACRRLAEAARESNPAQAVRVFESVRQECERHSRPPLP